MAEIVPETVAALRAASGHYTVNVALADGLERHEITGAAIFGQIYRAPRMARLTNLHVLSAAGIDNDRGLHQPRVSG